MPRPLSALLLAAALMLTACQPVDRFTTGAEESPSGPTSTPLDAPVSGVPGSLPELLERARDVAAGWQDEPQLAEVLVELGRDRRWRSAQATYLAPDADRFLVVTVDGDGLRQERPTLATLALQPVSAAGMAAVPAWPDGVREPAELVRAARDALRRCGGGRVTGVLYTTGAPVAWNGRRWTAPPAWTATVTAERGAVRMDPVSAAAGDCVNDASARSATS